MSFAGNNSIFTNDGIVSLASYAKDHPDVFIGPVKKDIYALVLKNGSFVLVDKKQKFKIGKILKRAEELTVDDFVTTSLFKTSSAKDESDLGWLFAIRIYVIYLCLFEALKQCLKLPIRSTFILFF